MTGTGQESRIDCGPKVNGSPESAAERPSVLVRPDELVQVFNSAASWGKHGRFSVSFLPVALLAHHFLLEKARTPNAVVDEDVCDACHHCAVRWLEEAGLLVNQHLHDVDRVVAV